MGLLLFLRAAMILMGQLALRRPPLASILPQRAGHASRSTKFHVATFSRPILMTADEMLQESALRLPRETADDGARL